MTNLLQYKDDPEFNEYLDSIGGIFEIKNYFSAPASQVLYEMDVQAYIEDYNDYITQQKNNFVQKVIDRFPAPIAFYFDQVEHGYENNFQRLHLLRSVWESIIYTFYALTLGEVVAKQINISTLRIFNNQLIKCDKNGLLGDRLGYKLEVIRKILKYDIDSLAPQLVVNSILSLPLIDTLEELNHERNSFSHIAALTESQAEDRCRELYPKVFDLLFNLKGLENISFIQFEKMYSAEEFKFFKFFGHSLRKRNYDKTLNLTFVQANLESFRQNVSFCEIQDSGEIICLSPFIHFILDEEKQPKISFLKKQDPDDLNKFIFEQVRDSPREVRIESNIFDKSIHKLRALL
ncbi:MAG: hypothetical protein EAZ76_12855 [Nostocales cyanobacterium]|nr:MAG: hypothetical protein EAZ87_20040 [Nostocales cyanobacterium]TAF12923.1 MAG: hypothetical protein EAZ76_12855 [Nostocales cyanobacterium]